MDSRLTNDGAGRRTLAERHIIPMLEAVSEGMGAKGVEMRFSDDVFIVAVEDSVGNEQEFRQSVRCDSLAACVSDCVKCYRAAI